MLFAGKKALVTGAASGIGRATAIRFAAEGASLTIGDRNIAGLEDTAGMIAAAGHTAPVVQAYDATDYASCRALVDTAARDGLDIVCNIAGLLKWGRSETFAAEDFDLLMHVNATSVFVICQAAMPHLLKSKGNIVNTSSTAAPLLLTWARNSGTHAAPAVDGPPTLSVGSIALMVFAVPS